MRMQRKTIQFVILFASTLAVLPAQQDKPPAVRGISIPAVAGSPFSATLVLEWESESPYGDIVQRRTINIIARDARGRTRNEVRRMMPESFHGSPPLISVRLFDPETRMRTACDLETLAGRREFVPEARAKPAKHKRNVTIEDLGASIMNGLEAKGTRRIADAEDEDGDLVELEDETWYSPDLHLTLLARHTDPRIGIAQTIGVSGLRREQPPASLFDLPPGCKIQDAPPAKPEPPEEPPSS